MAATDGVRTDQCDDLLVVETGESLISATRAEGMKDTIPHAVKDVSDMRSALGSIGKAAIRSGVLGEAVDSSRPPRDFGSGHLLDCSDTSKGPQVSVTNPGELNLDLLHQGSGSVEAVIGTMESLGFETHGGIVTITFHHIVRAVVRVNTDEDVFTFRQYRSLCHTFQTHARQVEEALGRMNRHRIQHR